MGKKLTSAMVFRNCCKPSSQSSEPPRAFKSGIRPENMPEWPFKQYLNGCLWVALSLSNVSRDVAPLSLVDLCCKTGHFLGQDIHLILAQFLDRISFDSRL